MMVFVQTREEEDSEANIRKRKREEEQHSNLNGETGMCKSALGMLVLVSLFLAKF